jgi:hypothetical protein
VAEHGEVRRFALLDPCWGRPPSERAYVSRSVAGALARHGAVDIVVPGKGKVVADGAFDVVPAPSSAGAGHTDSIDARRDRGGYDGVLVVAPAPPSMFELASRLGDVRLLVLGGSEPSPPDDAGTSRGQVGRLPLVVAPGGRTAPSTTDAHELDIPVAVHPSACDEPLNGIGCHDYLLVLGVGSPDVPPATTLGSVPLSAGARWLIARFARSFVLTLEHGVVTVWRSRSPLGCVRVGTRMDLWRLMAFARAVVDLAPGPLLARETIESMLLGTSVVVPDEGVAGYHAARGAAVAYRTVSELFDALDGGVATPAAADVRSYAATRYGSPGRLVEQVGAAFGLDS